MSSAAAVTARVLLRRAFPGLPGAVVAALGAVSLLVASPGAVAAQATDATGAAWEFLLASGRVVPTGAQRDAIRAANMTTAQLSYVPRPAFAITTMLGWARSRDIASAGDPKLDVFIYDIGAEARAHRWLAGEAVTFSPFAGVGAGARSYNYRSRDVDATHNAAAYGSAGGELGIGRVRLRLEARDYVTGFKPLEGQGSADTRNDVVLIAGLRLTTR